MVLATFFIKQFKLYRYLYVWSELRTITVKNKLQILWKNEITPARFMWRSAYCVLTTSRSSRDTSRILPQRGAAFNISCIFFYSHSVEVLTIFIKKTWICWKRKKCSGAAKKKSIQLFIFNCKYKLYKTFAIKFWNTQRNIFTNNLRRFFLWNKRIVKNV